MISTPPVPKVSLAPVEMDLPYVKPPNPNEADTESPHLSSMGDSGFIEDGVTDSSSAAFAKNRTYLAHYLTQTKQLLETAICPSPPLYVPNESSQKMGGYQSLQPPYCSVPVTFRYPSQDAENDETVPEFKVLNLLDDGLFTTATTVDFSLSAQSSKLVSKLSFASAHIDKLLKRIADKRSHVLVTGDLNAGKSTFVNTLLRKSIVPEDQQPCTALFVQVSDPLTVDGKDQVHGVRDPLSYDPTNSSTYEKHSMSELRDIVEENSQGYTLLNVYCRDNRDKQKSLLHNGLVDISLIDSPGLNIDSVTTTSLFSKQEEIDVIVFVVNAENHFTLSAKQFLKTATEEKAYVFIVVNKFDNIRRKDRCRNDILDQLNSISEDTYSHADSLVHFVSARSVTNRDEEGTIVDGSASEFVSADGHDWSAEFDKLEMALRSFILEKRSKSKLAPAKTYLRNLLTDFVRIADFNLSYLNSQVQIADSTVEQNKPSLTRMIHFKTTELDTFDASIEESSHNIESYTRNKLKSFLTDIDRFSMLVPYDGLFETWSYAHTLKRNILALGERRFQDALEYAQKTSLEHSLMLSSRAKEMMPDIPTLPIDTTPIERGFQQLQESEKTFLAELFDFIDVTDKFGIMRDLWPGMSLALGGLVGYQGFLSFNNFRLLSTASPFSRLSRLGFTGLMVTGAGLMLYALSDMHHSIRKRVVVSIKSHLETAQITEKNSTLVAKRSRGYLYQFVSDYRERFQHVLNEQQKVYKASESKREELNLCRNFFERLATQSKTLHSSVEALELDVD